MEMMRECSRASWQKASVEAASEGAGRRTVGVPETEVRGTPAAECVETSSERIKRKRAEWLARSRKREWRAVERLHQRKLGAGAIDKAELTAGTYGQCPREIKSNLRKLPDPVENTGHDRLARRARWCARLRFDVTKRGQSIWVRKDANTIGLVMWRAGDWYDPALGTSWKDGRLRLVSHVRGDFGWHHLGEPVRYVITFPQL